jgi:uncharacterized protein YjlB
VASSEPVVSSPQVVTYTLTDDGIFPNNAALPLLVYPQAVHLTGTDPAAIFEVLFNTHGWGNGWRNGIYSFHHYHSTAHEVLGIFRGQARVQCGGAQGVMLSLRQGDVVVIPAGVAHKNLGASRDFGVVGAYPFGQRWDTCYGKPGERPRADHNIAQVTLPQADPVHGEHGPLRRHWSGA